MQYEILFAAKNAGHSGIRWIRHWNEKTNNGGTSPVPDTGNTVGHFFFFGPVPVSGDECRNADADVCFLDVDAKHRKTGPLEQEHIEQGQSLDTCIGIK